jgi:hypothetical protein
VEKQEIELMAEALAMAASRHESMGHVTQGRFRFEHDEKARRMRELRARLTHPDLRTAHDPRRRNFEDA